MRIHKDVISGIVILLFCAVGALSTSQLPPPSAEEWAGPSTLPYITLGATALCGALLVITGIARRNADKASRSFNIDPKVLAFYVFWVCYMAAMVWLGDLISGMNRLGMPHNGGSSLPPCFSCLWPCRARQAQAPGNHLRRRGNHRDSRAGLRRFFQILLP